MRTTIIKVLSGLLCFSFFFLASCRKSATDTVSPQAPPAAGPVNASHSCVVRTVEADDPNGRGVLLTSKKWPNGSTIRVKFLNGTAFLQSKVRQYAEAWYPFANLRFQWVGSTEAADIRVAFNWNGDSGSWSYLGTDCRLIAAGSPTMNFGWFTATTAEAEFSRTTTHEFGHAIALVHEQSSPVQNISWNKPFVYNYTATNWGWSAAQTDANIFFKYSAAETNYSAYDPASIMHYAVPANWTTNGFSVGLNNYLSATDKSFIGQMYPFATTIKHTLLPGESLAAGQYLRSTDGRFTLVMQGDGNLVLYKLGNIALWHTFTNGTPANVAIMQSDGNFVVYGGNTAYWHTFTHGQPGAALYLQNDGNLVIYRNGVAIWNSGTHGN